MLVHTPVFVIRREVSVTWDVFALRPSVMANHQPFDLTDPFLRGLARNLHPFVLRVSGTSMLTLPDVCFGGRRVVAGAGAGAGAGADAGARAGAGAGHGHSHGVGRYDGRTFCAICPHNLSVFPYMRPSLGTFSTCCELCARCFNASTRVSSEFSTACPHWLLLIRHWM
jgi:hypothetical protein